MLLGAGRDRAEDPIDHAVGVIVRAPCGEQVRVGDAVLEVHHRGEARLPAALELLRQAVVIGDAPPPEQPQILETIG
jgi:thymidine phosphorylase